MNNRVYRHFTAGALIAALSVCLRLYASAAGFEGADNSSSLARVQPVQAQPAAANSRQGAVTPLYTPGRAPTDYDRQNNPGYVKAHENWRNGQGVTGMRVQQVENDGTVGKHAAVVYNRVPPSIAEGKLNFTKAGGYDGLKNTDVLKVTVVQDGNIQLADYDRLDEGKSVSYFTTVENMRAWESIQGRHDVGGEVIDFAQKEFFSVRWGQDIEGYDKLMQSDGPLQNGSVSEGEMQLLINMQPAIKVLIEEQRATQIEARQRLIEQQQTQRSSCPGCG